MTIPYERHNKQQANLLEITSSFDLTILKDKPFWIWNKEEHYKKARESITSAAGGEGRVLPPSPSCCFNHSVGLPQKDGKEYPLFDYEKLLYDSPLGIDGVFKYRYLWVKKATRLGITEFFLRITAWLCTSGTDRGTRNCQMCIVTGPNIDIAIKLIIRLKNTFERKLGLTFSSKETVLEFNGYVIEAFPSNHVDSFRALDNPKFILLGRVDFFRKGEQEDVRFVTERNICKSDPYIVVVSTPNAPNGLFDRLEREPESACIYKTDKVRLYIRHWQSLYERRN